ncbi:MAG: hypothetical protein ABW184_15390 [Sphingobium sp.]
MDQHRKLWKALLTGGAGGVMREELMRLSRQLADERGNIDWMPLDLATIWTVTLIVESLAWWVSQPDGRYPIDEVAHIIHRGSRALRTPP